SAAFWLSVSFERCLNRASSFQTNSTSSWKSDFGLSPSLRAMVNRNSALADCDESASSLHQAGQAASIRGSLRPASFRRFLSASRSASMVHLAVGYSVRPGTDAQNRYNCSSTGDEAPCLSSATILTHSASLISPARAEAAAIAARASSP